MHTPAECLLQHMLLVFAVLSLHTWCLSCSCNAGCKPRRVYGLHALGTVAVNHGQ